MTKTVLISEYFLYQNHAGMAGVHDLHCLFHKYGAFCLDYQIKKKSLVNKFTGSYSVTADSAKNLINANIIIVCNTPKIFGIFNTLKKELEKARSVSVIFIDGFDADTINGFGARSLDLIDYAFSPVTSIVDKINAHGKRCKAHHLPYGVDSLSIANKKPEKCVDIYNYGRVDKDLHNFLCDDYLNKNPSTFYVFSSFLGAELVNQNRHKDLHWNTLLRTKVSFCFEASKVARFNGASPVLYRWFECLAAGVLVFGSRPKDANTDELLFWENSTFETNVDWKKTGGMLDDVFKNYDQYVATAETSRRNVLKFYDWRYRISEIYKIAGIEAPKKLKEELSLLSIASKK